MAIIRACAHCCRSRRDRKDGWRWKRIERVGLIDYALRRADQLSGGQQQRVGIARAMVQQPALILADEPVASLDPATADRVLGLLHDICNADGITAIVSLHQLDLRGATPTASSASRRARIVFDGPPEQARQAPRCHIYGSNVGGSRRRCRIRTFNSRQEPTHEPPHSSCASVTAARIAVACPHSLRADDPAKLRVALLPDENAATLIQNAQPLKAHLEKALKQARSS